MERNQRGAMGEAQYLGGAIGQGQNQRGAMGERQYLGGAIAGFQNQGGAMGPFQMQQNNLDVTLPFIDEPRGTTI